LDNPSVPGNEADELPGVSERGNRGAALRVNGRGNEESVRDAVSSRANLSTGNVGEQRYRHSRKRNRESESGGLFQLRSKVARRRA
jgi:hypothetical protein